MMKLKILALAAGLALSAAVLPGIVEPGVQSPDCRDGNKFNSGHYDGPPKHKGAECRSWVIDVAYADNDPDGPGGTGGGHDATTGYEGQPGNQSGN